MAKVYSEDFDCIEGEQFTLTVTLTDNVGDAIDISGATLLLTVKRSLSGQQTVFTSNGTVTSGVSGIGTFPITSDNTAASGSYKYTIDVTFTNAEIRKAIGNFTIHRA